MFVFRQSQLDGALKERSLFETPPLFKQPPPHQQPQRSLNTHTLPRTHTHTHRVRFHSLQEDLFVLIIDEVIIFTVVKKVTWN